MSPARIGIIGGGYAGLTAAYELQKKGHAITVLEKHGRWGGQAATLPLLGTHIEHFYHHLFGSDEEPDSLVLTEDDYLRFLVRLAAEEDRLPEYIPGALAPSKLLFVGYNLYDWPFRVVLHGPVSALDRRRHKVKDVAVQLDLEGTGETNTTAMQAFLQQYLQNANINIFWGSTAQFMAEFREQWDD